MPRAAVDQLLYLLDESFEGIEKPWHTMLGNLASVTEDDWLWVPPDGARTIRQITSHGRDQHIRALSQRNDDA